MTNEKHGALGACKHAFEPLDTWNVQVVGRFIEQEQVRFLGDCLCKKNAAFLTARKGVVKGFRIDARFSENVFAGGVPFRSIPDHNIADSAFDVGGDFLNQSGDSQAVLADDFARIRFHFARDDFEKGAFSFSVTAHETNAFAFVDVERHGIEKRRVAKTESQIFYGK